MWSLSVEQTVQISYISCKSFNNYNLVFHQVLRLALSNSFFSLITCSVIHSVKHCLRVCQTLGSMPDTVQGAVGDNSQEGLLSP